MNTLFRFVSLVLFLSVSIPISFPSSFCATNLCKYLTNLLAARRRRPF